jgi:2-dehydropantoate 2-reductase
MRSIPETRSILGIAVEETASVGRASGISLPKDIIEKTMSFYDGLPDGATSSMQRDIQAVKPSELESQTGAVVRLGIKVGEPTPVNTYLYGSLLPLELKARGEINN